MANKTFKGRILNKHDISTNWSTANDNGFIPLNGEIIIYDDLNKIKIGDGTTLVSNLPFLNYSEEEILELITTEAAPHRAGIYFVKDTDDASTVAGTWLVQSNDITEYYDGLTIALLIPISGNSSTTLNINNLGAKPVYRYGTVRLTTLHPVNSVIILVYSANKNAWYATDYDTNTDTKVNTVLNTTTKAYILGTTTTPTTSNKPVTTIADTGVFLGEEAGTLVATTFEGYLDGTAAHAELADLANAVLGTLEIYANGTDKKISYNGSTNPTLNITTGSTNGTISINDTDVAVQGLGSNAYTSTAYLPLTGGTITQGGDAYTRLVVKSNGSADLSVGSDYTKVTLSSTASTAKPYILFTRNNINDATISVKSIGTLQITSAAGGGASTILSTYGMGTSGLILSTNGTSPSWVDGASLIAPKKITLVATAGQTSFSIPFEYDSLSSNLTVYFNGILMKETDNYIVDTTNNTVDLVDFSAEAGDIVTIMGLLGALSIDFGQEAINAINEINVAVATAKQEIDDKIDNAMAEIDAKIDEIEAFVNELPDDTTKLMAKNTNNTMESGYKITMASNYTPSENYDVATKLYVDNITSGLATLTYVNNLISTATSSIVTDVFATGSTSPDNGYSGTEATKRRKLLWIDTGNSDPGLKYYNGSSWVTVPVRWS